MRVLPLIIGCDTDPDRAGMVDGVGIGSLSWRGLTEGIPRLKESVADLTDHRGSPPVFTWLLRVDEQIRELQGSYVWVLDEHHGFLEQLENSGDELGWHPHFWRRESSTGQWYQETASRDWQLNMLRHAHRAYAGVFPGRPQSVRMGWDYHNNETYRALADLGIKVEFSAIPGLRTQVRSGDSRHENQFDWFDTPRRPYYPANADYRRPAKEGEKRAPLLEVPNFTSQSRLWSLISGLQMARKTGNLGQLIQSIKKPVYWINITARPKLYAPLIAQLRRDLRTPDTAPPAFVTYFHPDELVENRSSLYELKSVRANLRSIIDACAERGTAVEFCRAKRIPDLLKDSGFTL